MASAEQELKAESSYFAKVEGIPPDKIFLTKTQFKQDKSPVKYNLGIGAYRTPEGKPLVLNVVRKVEKEIANNNSLNKEYFPIGGNADFIKNAQKLILGDQYDKILNTKRGIAGVQGLSGTGSLRLLFSLIKVLSDTNGISPEPTIWISNPTWGNHKKIIGKARLNYNEYRYWDPKTKGLDINGLKEDLSKAKKGDVILLHPCAHNPTGVDPSREQWKEICDLMKKQGLMPYFDSAYQGFATGDLSNDAWAIQYFVTQEMEMFIAQSFSKNLGLYNERIGCASVVVNDPTQVSALNSHLCGIIRPMYSNPPSHGARIVNAVLESKENEQVWYKEMKGMSNQIFQARCQLRYILETKYSNQFKLNSWKHITDQIGMFCFSGLTPQQVERLKLEHHIYMLTSGRISMAGVSPTNQIEIECDNNGKLTLKKGKIEDITTGNVVYLADKIAEVDRWAQQQDDKDTATTSKS